MAVLGRSVVSAIMRAGCVQNHLSNFFPYYLSRALQNCKPSAILYLLWSPFANLSNALPLMYLAKNDYRHYHQYIQPGWALSIARWIHGSSVLHKTMGAFLQSIVKKMPII